MEDISRYLFLASAIAGRRVGIHLSSGADVLAYSDGQSIILPAASAQCSHDAWRQVVVQAALIGAGSLEAPLMSKLVGRPESARRYGYLEVLRAASFLEDRLPSAFLNLREFRSAEVPTSSAVDSLDWALSRRPLPESPSYFGCLRPLMTLRKAVSEQGFAALTNKQIRGTFEQTKVDEFDDDDATEESKLLKLFQNPLAGSNPLSGMIKKILGVGSSRGNREKNPNEDGGAEMSIGRVERALRRGIHAVMTRLPFEIPDIDTRAERSSLAYPEWDVHRQQYRLAWAVVDEVEAWRPDGVRDIDDVFKPAGNELKRQLGSLGLDHEMHRRQHDGAELDVGQLLDSAIDLAAGYSPRSLDVYRASRRTRRDLAVAIALDISGSTGERNADGIALFDQQLQSAYQLGRTLNDLGDTVAMFGFHSWGRSLVRAVRLKGSEERWSARIAERFARLEPFGYTRTGAAVRHGARLLQERIRLPNRLLVLITDGISYDQGYESDYAEGDARKALEEARSGGTACVCLCVGGSTDAEKLKSVFGGANLLIVDEPRQVAMKIRQICRQALASVSQRHLKRRAET